MTANKEKLPTASRKARNMEGNKASQSQLSMWESYGTNNFQSHLYFEWRFSCVLES